MSLRNNSRTEEKPAVKKEPILCYVTDGRSLPIRTSVNWRDELLRVIESAAGAGINWIQIREKELSGKDLAFLTREALRRIGAGRDATRVLVNDRLDVALAERAGGVHLGENSLPVAEAKRWLKSSPAAHTLPWDFLVGASCHSLPAAESAASTGADYIFFGPVFATPSKAAYGPPQGINRLAEICRAVSIPVLAIGAVTLENAAACLSAGAAGVAAIRLFQETRDLSSVVLKLHKLTY